MTVADIINKPVTKPRILVQLDIGRFNFQWVNIGAGIWCLYIEADYPFVDSSLLDSFSVQTFTNIGSVTVDGILQTKSDTLLGITNQQGYWYYNSDDKALFVSLIHFDEPSLHDISIGIIYGYSFNEFTPVGDNQLYEGRLLTAPEISSSRDPLYWGKMAFDAGNISLINGDGELDTFAQDNDIYGNQARIYLGYDEIDIDDYLLLYTGLIETVSIGEDFVSIQLSDKRKQLTAPIQYSCTNLNALDAIVEILTAAYPVEYTSTFFDITAWEEASLLVPDITIDMQEQEPVIDVIQNICASIFGLFLITPEGKYSFKIVDTTASAETVINRYDIFNRHTINYDPSEVISSVKVGYAKDWATVQNPYTYLIDTSREEDIFLKYKTYNQKTFDTFLTSLSDAQDFSDTILDYAEEVHGKGNITVPMKYYTLDVGDLADIEIYREVQNLLGIKKSEIIRKSYDLDRALINFEYRFV